MVIVILVSVLLLTLMNLIMIIACTIVLHRTQAEAVEIANDTIYGLNAGVAGGDDEHAMQVAAQLRSGQVHVNTTDPNGLVPFGGYKQSGDGREWGLYGFEEFLQVKAINRPKQKAKL